MTCHSYLAKDNTHYSQITENQSLNTAFVIKNIAENLNPSGEVNNQIITLFNCYAGKAIEDIQNKYPNLKCKIIAPVSGNEENYFLNMSKSCQFFLEQKEPYQSWMEAVMSEIIVGLSKTLSIYNNNINKTIKNPLMYITNKNLCGQIPLDTRKLYFKNLIAYNFPEIQTKTLGIYIDKIFTRLVQLAKKDSFFKSITPFLNESQLAKHVTKENIVNFIDFGNNNLLELIKSKTIPLNGEVIYLDNDGQMHKKPLASLAIDNNDMETLQYLSESKEFNKLLTQIDELGVNPLQHSINIENKEIFSFLIDKIHDKKIIDGLYVVNMKTIESIDFFSNKILDKKNELKFNKKRTKILENNLGLINISKTARPQYLKEILEDKIHLKKDRKMSI